MILDQIKNAAFYENIHPRIALALKEAIAVTKENFPSERIVADGDRLYLNPAEYETHSPENARLEAHRQYVDVMVMVEGEEVILVKDTDALSEITMPYDDKKDVLLAKLDPDCTPLRMTEGSFAVLFPQDAHAPGCYEKEPKRVKKIIAKVKLS